MGRNKHEAKGRCGRVPKYTRYQDYVIRDGRLIGEFEQMYQDFADPWNELKCEQFASDKAAGLNLLARLKDRHGVRKVLEVGCGFGHYTTRMVGLGLEALGVDISETAIQKARQMHRGARFVVGRIDQHQIFRDYRPDVIVMAEVTWYVLDHLRSFLDFLKAELPNTYLLHLLNTYPPGVQTYGAEFFTELRGIKKYFGMQWLESGKVQMGDEGGARTWLLGTWMEDAAKAWHALI
jgi:SAM-dependent methyltransferase